MKRARTALLTGFAALLLAFSFAGCDTFESVFDRDEEVSATIEEVGDDFIVADAIRYEVTSDTEYEGINGLADLSVGDEVEIEYEESGGTRRALEIELAGAEDDD